jgi:GxxExxY protein
MRTGGQEEHLIKLGESIIGAAIKVHSHLGPGLLESVYETCLVYELRRKGLAVETQRVLPIQYEDLVVDSALRLDILVEDQVVLEIKSVNQLQPIHKAQLISYLRLGSFPLGYLMNFNEVHMRDGIKRVVARL